MKKSLKTDVFNSSGIDIPERCQNSKNSEAFKTKSFEDDNFCLSRLRGKLKMINKKAQISETMIWMAAYVIIFMIILIFILIGVALSKDKKVETIKNNLDFVAVNSFVMMLNNTVEAADNITVYKLILKADDSKNRYLIDREIKRFIEVQKLECYIIKSDYFKHMNTAMKLVKQEIIDSFIESNGVEIRIADKAGKEVKMGVFIGKC